MISNDPFVASSVHFKEPASRFVVDVQTQTPNANQSQGTEKFPLIVI